MAPFSIDQFFLFLSNYLAAFPELQKYMNELYQTQKIRFYEKAKESIYYDSTIMTDKPLEWEVSMKRTFGILLCSQDDEQLQDAILSTIDEIYPPIKELCSHYTRDGLSAEYKKYINYCNNTKRTHVDTLNAFVYYVAYKIYCTHGFETADPEIQDLYAIIAKDLKGRQFYNLDKVLERWDSVRPKEFLTVPRNQRKLLDTIQSGQDLLDFGTILITWKDPNAPVVSSSALEYKRELFRPLAKEDTYDTVSALLLPMLMGYEFDTYGLSVNGFFAKSPITKIEKDRALKILADSVRHLPRVFDPTINLTLYTAALLFGQFAKKLREEKDFYFANNSETQYNELKKASAVISSLEEEITRLNDRLRVQDQHIDVLRTQVDGLSAELLKDTKDAMRPLNEEIAFLRSQIATLQEELNSEKEKTNELNYLREFVFSMQSGQDIAKTEVQLKDVIADKRIYIFGGHINWRNKMKINYPSLKILDGHQESFDEQILLNADMVLLNTSNMSHGLYYKVIDVLRKNRIPFDYIGKYSNVDLLEREIVEILQKC